ncbi:MAG: hypothetical protein A3K19_07665 [Lentisphaerae bacterium RIFOXYB12_FULL_65_16]|nr:MAG: hypothetical protein A3K18_07475 [Lentisphaerae bacterium RIFOXYA12_64_32]OGV87526.1 MAG: hypothetical protein A3K19_07665 [Lentisphaerae bacterium RIFOXYB12_FULL_65_16]
MAVKCKCGARSAVGRQPLRVALCGRNLRDIADILRGFPVRVVERQPDVVISYGGDGALLGAERDFPGVPKCPIRDRRSAPKCARHGEEQVVELLLAGRLRESRLSRLEAEGPAGTRLAGINDVLVNKKNIASAVRFRLWLDGQLYKSQVVGDGLVVATPFGSTGYYRSITHSLFRVGVGLAFNNSTEPLDHLVVDGSTLIEVEILRGPAVLLADNDPARISLNKGDRVAVRRSDAETTILGLDVFRCEDCYQLRQDGNA